MYQGSLSPISNRADWFGTLELVNDGTDEVITDLTGVEVEIVLRDRLCKTPRLTATMANGKVTTPGGGVIQWQFTEPEMSSICAGSYEIGMTLTRDGVVVQQIIGVQPVLDGIVQ